MAELSATAMVGERGLLGIASFWLLKMLWPQAEVSRLLKPMLVTQMNWKYCWFTLWNSSEFFPVRQLFSLPVLQGPVSIPQRGRPDCTSTLRA